MSVEQIEGTNEADVITGSAADEVLFGSYGSDVLEGLGGTSIQGGELNDTMDGGPGTDEANFRNAFNRLVINLAGRASTGQGEDTLLNFEDIYGGSRNDFIIGDEGPNRLHGGDSGEDTLRGQAGDDRLIAGRDDLTGRAHRSTSKMTSSGGPGTMSWTVCSDETSQTSLLQPSVSPRTS